MTLRLGVLAIQGDVYENVSSLRDSVSELGLDAIVCMVKTPEQIAELDGMVIPGGESTTIGRLLLANKSLDQIKLKVASGMPVLGICAGMVLLAGNTHDKTVGKTEQPLLGFLDVDLERNSFGRQRESFETDISLDSINVKCTGVFIRAPAITSAPNDVEVLGKLDEKIIAVKKGNIVGISFHPELTENLSVHKYFVNLVNSSKQ